MEIDQAPTKRSCKIGDKVYVLGIAKRAYLGEKPTANDFTSNEIKCINLDGLPMCRMHDPNILPGKWDMSIAQDDIAFVFGHVDVTNPMTQYFVHEMQSGYLKDLSMNHYVWAYKDKEDNNKLNILKLPIEISAVDTGLQEGCHILGVFFEDEVHPMDPTKTPQISAPQSPPAQAPGTPATPAQATPPPAQPQMTPPQPLAPEIQADLKHIDEKHLMNNDHATVVKLCMALAERVNAQNADIQKIDEYKALIDNQKKNEIEEMKKQFYTIMPPDQSGKEHQEQFSKSIDSVFGNKAFQQLQDEGRLFKTAMANGSYWKQANMAAQAEIERLKANSSSSVARDDYASKLLNQVNGHGPQRTSTSSQRFNPYDVNRAEKAQEPAPVPAIKPEEPKNPRSEINYALPAEGTMVHQRAMRDPNSYHQLQVNNQNSVDPRLLERLSANLSTAPRSFTTPQKQY